MRCFSSLSLSLRRALSVFRGWESRALTIVRYK